MYLHDASRSSDNPDETGLSPANAGELARAWVFETDGIVAASPIVAGGSVYVGSWDGYLYALDAKTGRQKWRTYLGQTNAPNCDDFPYGVTSSAAVDDGVVYVDGGDSYFYALDAATGSVAWRVFVGDNSAPSGHYNWSSPLLYNGYAYIGVASFCDEPLVQGQLLQISLGTHQITRTFNTVPSGRVGGGIWTSPSIDSSTNTIFVTTGNEGGPNQPYARAIVALDASTLAARSVWQLPPPDIPDADWGTTPVLVTDFSGRKLVTAANKDGYVYTFDRANLSAGYLWRTRIAVGGPDPDGNGDGTVSSAAFDGSNIYAAGGRTTVDGDDADGAVRALDPATGHVRWEHAAHGWVLAASTYANGLVIIGGGSEVEVLDASDGSSLFSYDTDGVIYGPPTVSNGYLYASSTDGSVYAFTAPGADTSGGQCTIAHAIDGETVQCADGSRVRFVGVASPLGADAGSGWATALTNWLLAGKTLTLEVDATPFDQFGSRYGYPHVRGTDGNDYNVSVLLVYVGMAHHLSDGVNTRHGEWLNAAQNWARAACWNMWASGNPFAAESGCR
jgi:outer membrane protein assembly factor BamB